MPSILQSRFLRVLVVLVAAAPVAARTASAQQAERRPRNLKVLSPDLTRDSVVTIMRRVVASGLGVTCSFCHGAPDVPFDSIDFSSDERDTKRTAREMMRMVSRINTELLPAIPGRGTPPLE